MKILKTGAFIALLTICYLHSAAQVSTPPINEPDYNKPKIFSDLSDNLALPLADMEALFSLSKGTQVNTVIDSGFNIVGTVVSKSNPSDATLKSIVVKTQTRQGAILTFTQIKNADGSFSYTGRMMSKAAGDALIIVKEGNSYVFRKTNYYNVINE